MTQNRQVESLWNRNFLLLVLSNALITVAFHMVTPMLTKYAIGLGVSIPMAGVLSGVFSITALIFRPFIGVLADRTNRQYLILLGGGLLGLGTLGLSLVTQYGYLMAFRVIQGVGFAINGTASIALASDYMPKDKIGQGVGYFAVSNVLASSLGPTIGLSLVDSSGGFTALFTVAAIFPFIGAAMVFALNGQILVPELKKTKGIHLNSIIAPEILPFALFTGTFSVVSSLISAFLVVSAEEKGIGSLTAYYLIHSAFLLVIRPFAGKLADKKGGAAVLLPAYLCAACAALLVGTAQSKWVIYIAAVFAALGMGAGSPTCQAECIKRLPPERRGVAVSTYYIGADVAQGLAPSIGGRIVDAAGYANMYYIASAFALTIGAVYFCFDRMEKRNMQKQRP